MANLCLKWLRTSMSFWEVCEEDKEEEKQEASKGLTI
jgi:hypothetical protein